MFYSDTVEGRRAIFKSFVPCSEVENELTSSDFDYESIFPNLPNILRLEQVEDGLKMSDNSGDDDPAVIRQPHYFGAIADVR